MSVAREFREPHIDRSALSPCCPDDGRCNPADHAADLRDAGAELLVSSAAWWPGQWGPDGEWEARTTETDLSMIVCNRTGTDGPARLATAESVVIDRGQRLLALSSPTSSLFMIDCKFTDGHITSSTATEVRL
jgi:predicted amidohydrolase